MFFQAVILAALSAGALADNLYLTAFAPDTNCTAKPIGNNVTIPINETAKRYQAASTCHTYTPDHGQFIQIDYPFAHDGGYLMLVYNDTSCKDLVFNVRAKNYTEKCIPMNSERAFGTVPDWKSVQIFNE